MIAYIATYWRTGPDGDNAPAIFDDLPPVWPDWAQVAHAVGGAPTDPNILIVELHAASLDAVLAHPDYGPGAILYDLPNPYPPGQRPTAAEYGLRRAYCARLGMSQTQFTALFGTLAGRKPRGEAAQNVIAWARNLPKRTNP